MDELTQKLLVDPELFGKAMALLKKYQNLDGMDWQTVEEFLMGLDEGETAILDSAIEQHSKGVIQLPSFSSHSNNTITTSNVIPTTDSSIEALAKAIGNAISASASQLTSQSKGIQPASSITVQELVNRFIEYKKPSYKAGTAASNTQKLELFIRIITEYNHGITVQSVNVDASMIRHYRDTLKRIPAYRNTFPPNATINDMVNSGRKVISPKTMQDSSSLAGEFISWIEAEGYPFEKGLRPILQQIKKPRESANSRQPFNDDGNFQSSCRLDG